MSDELIGKTVLCFCSTLLALFCLYLGPSFIFIILLGWFWFNANVWSE